jgi:hypothetical protein
MTTTATDPKNPATKPHGTTEDQVKEMENEGQAATSQATPGDAVESPSADQTQGSPGPVRSSLDKTMSDQDIDTAGTEADEV